MKNANKVFEKWTKPPHFTLHMEPPPISVHPLLPCLLPFIRSRTSHPINPFSKPISSPLPYFRCYCISQIRSIREHSMKCRLTQQSCMPWETWNRDTATDIVGSKCIPHMECEGIMALSFPCFSSFLFTKKARFWVTAHLFAVSVRLRTYLSVSTVWGGMGIRGRGWFLYHVELCVWSRGLIEWFPSLPGLIVPIFDHGRCSVRLQDREVCIPRLLFLKINVNEAHSITVWTMICLMICAMPSLRNQL